MIKRCDPEVDCTDSAGECKAQDAAVQASDSVGRRAREPLKQSAIEAVNDPWLQGEYGDCGVARDEIAGEPALVAHPAIAQRERFRHRTDSSPRQLVGPRCEDVGWSIQSSGIPHVPQTTRLFATCGSVVYDDEDQQLSSFVARRPPSRGREACHVALDMTIQGVDMDIPEGRVRNSPGAVTPPRRQECQMFSPSRMGNDTGRRDMCMLESKRREDQAAARADELSAEQWLIRADEAHNIGMWRAASKKSVRF